MRLEINLLRDLQNPFQIPEQFIKNFRLTKQIFHNLVIQLKPHSTPEIRGSRIPFHLRMFTLYFLSNGSYQTTIGGHNFNCVSQSVDRYPKYVY